MLEYLSERREIKMSKVVEKVKVTNFKVPSKSIEIEAVIDTGATMSVLPMDLIQKLGLEKIDEVNVRYADNSVKRKEVYGWVILEIAGRKAVFDVLAENEGAQPLIGQIVLERLDLVEPSTRRVIPNPRSPETPMIEILATSPNTKIRLRCLAPPPKFGKAEIRCRTLCDMHHKNREEIKKCMTLNLVQEQQKADLQTKMQFVKNLTTGRMMKMPNFGLKSWVMIQIKLIM